MASWSSRRKLTYALIVVFALLVFIVVPAFLVFYKAPTCFDGKMNGNETGFDCGGSCARLCQSAFLPPRVEWGGAKFERLADGLYNVAAYIVNPNMTGAAVDVPYKMALYDDRGILITERAGKVTLYPHRNSLAFQTAVDVDKRVPTKATFEFTSPPNWFKSTDNLWGLAVLDKKYQEDDIGSSLEVTLENTTLIPYEDVQVSVVLYDIDGNAIGFSQTRIDALASKNSREIAPYTWPVTRNGRVTTIEVIPSIQPIVDRN
jgi:hypothetical protein